MPGVVRVIRFMEHWILHSSLYLRSLLVGLAGVVWATAGLAAAQKDPAAELGPAQQAQAAGDYARAFALYSRFSAHNPLAQFNLGLFYRNGWGRRADPAKACGWFEKAAHRHVPVAQQFFGDCLAAGIDRPADGAAAMGWYRQAADGGDLIALCSLADLLIDGKGVEKDVPGGLSLCTGVAQAGSPPAMRQLADYYREGRVVPQDLAAARGWYRQAADRGDRESQYRFGVMLSEGQGGEADAPAALYWLETAASAGYAPAYLPTAILYANVLPEPDTGALAPAHLAKIYMWNSAARATRGPGAEQAEIARIDTLVGSVMPATWRPDLDKRVAEHLAKYHPAEFSSEKP